MLSDGGLGLSVIEFESLRAATMEKHNMTAAEFDDVAKKIREIRWEDPYEPPEWNYADSFWFVVVLLTTIGKPDK